MRSLNYLGSTFQIWTRNQTWFWSLSGSSIGAAATESEAIREACISIDEIVARREAEEVHRPVATLIASRDWEESLTSLERYLSRVSAPAA
jgi:hypothetical protein